MSNAQMIFGVDIDGVLADLHTPFTAYSAEKLGRELPKITDWDISIPWKISSDELSELFRGFTEARLYRDLPVVEGASEAMWRLHEAGVHLRIITHRLFLPGLHNVFMEDTGHWLQKNDLPFWDICVMGKGGRKFDVGADVYLDDGPHVVEALRDHGKLVVVFDRPYNQHLAGPRARNWGEVVTFFESTFGLDVPAVDNHQPWPANV